MSKLCRSLAFEQKHNGCDIPMTACHRIPYPLVLSCRIRPGKAACPFCTKGCENHFTTVVTHREACCVGVNGIEAFKIDGGLYGQVRA